MQSAVFNKYVLRYQLVDRILKLLFIRRTFVNLPVVFPSSVQEYSMFLLRDHLIISINGRMPLPVDIIRAWPTLTAWFWDVLSPNHHPEHLCLLFR
jgi:hypothetical protein